MTNPSGTKSGTVPAVVAGALALVISYLDDKGAKAEMRLAPLPGKGPQMIDLSDEGPLTFIDLADKKQVERREKLRETAEKHPSLVIAPVCFFSDVSKKYGAILRCVATPGNTCGTLIRKWTSDLHQSHRCDTCGIKAKRLKAKVKRSAKASSVPGALPSQPSGDASKA